MGFDFVLSLRRLFVVVRQGPIIVSGPDGTIGVLKLQDHEPRCGVAIGRPELLDQRFSASDTIAPSICRKPLLLARWAQAEALIAVRHDFITFLGTR